MLTAKQMYQVVDDVMHDRAVSVINHEAEQFAVSFRRDVALARANGWIIELPNEPALKDKDLVENVFCPTGPGGGVDPSCSPGGASIGAHDLLTGKGLSSYVGSKVKVTKQVLSKIEHLNPKGLLKGTIKVPWLSDKNKAELSKVLPTGTKIQYVYTSAKNLGLAAKADASTAVPAKPEAKPEAIVKQLAPSSTPQAEMIQIPKSMEGMKVIKELPGSTHPKLVEGKDGLQWVAKSGEGKKDQLRNEADADRVYRAMGVATPYSGLSEDHSTKFAWFLKGGQTLGDWEKGKSLEVIAAMHKEIGKNMALDALLANWDVVGQNKDNILIHNGKPFRIDNGGALKYRAQGAPKGDKFTNDVKELSTFREPSKGISKVFGNVTNAELREQMQHIVDNKDKIMNAIHDNVSAAAIGVRITDFQKKLDAGFGSESSLGKAERKSLAEQTEIEHPEGKTAEKWAYVKDNWGGEHLSDKDYFATKEWWNGLKEGEQDAVSQWKNDSHIKRHNIINASTVMNGAYVLAEDKLSPGSKRFLSALEKAPKFVGMTYRNVDSSSSGIADIIGGKLKEGDTWVEKGPHCCSRSQTSFGASKSVRLHIKSLTGRNIANGYYPDEQEVTGMPGTAYKITKIEKTTNLFVAELYRHHWDIHLEEQP